MSQSRLEAAAEATALSLHLLLVSNVSSRLTMGNTVCVLRVRKIDKRISWVARARYFSLRCRTLSGDSDARAREFAGGKKVFFVVPRIHETKLLFVVNFFECDDDSRKLRLLVV